jgi:two-component system sensor histidine kinase CiaH
MDTHFHSAILKLTAWYMLIVFLICVGFSFIIYGLSSVEFQRRLPAPDGSNIRINQSILDEIRDQRATEAQSRLAASLLVVNIGALTLGGFGSYFLARRTLHPIQLAAQAQGRFISDASHELRTPLAVMQSEIEIALRGAPTKADLQTLAASNLEEVNRLRELSDRLLQLNSGGTIALGPVIVEQAVTEAAMPHFRRADEKSIDIINKTDTSVALASHDHLRDVLSILIDNAIKYSDPGAAITIKSHSNGRTVYVQVSDHGRGIDEHDLPLIFDRFYRADSSRTNADVSGHGLGLSIAKQIIERMHGDVSVKSVIGKGSTFTIKLDNAKK